MAETLSDRIHVRAEEIERTQETSSIDNTTSRLDCGCANAIAEMAQAHYDEVQQLKRTHAYEMYRLRTQKHREIRAMVQASTAAQATRLDQVKECRRRYRMQKKTHAYQMGLLSREKEYERALVLEEVEALDAGYAELKHKFRAQKTANHGLISEMEQMQVHLNEKDKQLKAMRLRTSGLVNKHAIVDILSKEIRAATNSQVSREEANMNRTSDARQELRALKNICTTRRSGLKIRYDNLRHQEIEIQLPVDRDQVTTAAGKYQKLVTTDMDNLLHWLDEVVKDLTRRDVSLVERIDRVYSERTEGCNQRLERLHNLADLCGVRGRLAFTEDSDDESD
ncbi:hypothetical protein HBI67_065830 [Parastagonospora nodorum]|nr:hypothetical protein HBI79_047320 [Parastagonospora nodorum]KAH6074363.1 hypothetical protein HBI67_065830 [Parastagonospora nodorum]KAH6088317.1 hypothetical protein HBI66_031550 [Parastagonospora nodorum]